MLKKYFIFVLILTLAAFSFGCSGSSDDEKDSQDVSTKIFEAVNHARIDTKSSETKDTQTFGNPPYWTCTYTFPDDSSYPQIYTYEFTWLIGYSYGGVTLSNGTTTLTMTVNSNGSWNYSYTGSFDVTYNGELYDYSWNIEANYNSTSGQYSYSGTYTLNGEDYDFTYSGAI